MLRVQGLGKRFGELVALEAFDLELARGACAALVGHNGSGKSTALACLAGRARRSTGTVTFGGVPLFEKTEDRRARALVSYVGDAPAFYPDLSVREHVLMVAVAHGMGGEADERVDRLLAELHLTHRRDHLPMHLSAGMQQKLQLACGLIRPFDILVLDEPARHLDLPTIDWLATRLEAERDRGACVLFASHEPGFVRRLTGEVVTLVDGHVAARGSFDEVARTSPGRQAGLDSSW